MTSRGDPAGRQMSLFGEERHDTPPALPPVEPDADTAARSFAVDPRNNVVLEASAGTGKTSVLVSRYINLLAAGVDPANILAITFTRKAAAEMRERIVAELRRSAASSEVAHGRWIELRDRLADISICTIDAFCLSLLREFPLEADLDPGFAMADETEVPRLVELALDRSLRIFARLAQDDADVALVLAQLGVSRTREGLAALLERRLVAWEALDRFLARGPADLSAPIVCRRAVTALRDVLRTAPGGPIAFLGDGPVAHARYRLLVRELERLPELERSGDAAIRAVLDRVAAHFLTAEGGPRRSGAIHPYRPEHYPSIDASRRHRGAVFHLAPAIQGVVAAFGRDLNALLARGLRRMFAVALAQYRRELEDRAVLDFSDVLERALGLLARMDEFAQSRFRLESRYHHVLVDEFQDTSRAQWELIALLIRSWGEGAGLAAQPSVFVVGDRKQSIYRFRDADVAVLEDAASFINALRPEGQARRSIAKSFRAVPPLQQFVNDLFAEIATEPARPDDFRYGDADRFPLAAATEPSQEPVLGIAVGADPEICSSAVAEEISRILREGIVRDRRTGIRRQARPGDIAILFRSRASHRELERELEARGIPSYVYKGLGFFDADETKDLIALVRYLAEPLSGLRAAALLRSRFLRISDAGLSALAPHLARALIGPVPDSMASLSAEDRRVLEHARRYVPGWVESVDRVPPAELVEQILDDTAYACELRGPRRLQAWENLKKMRALVRRIQNRGYATLRRLADHVDSLTAGDESNAVLEALDAVNLMTVHASKGLEFPIVFVVNLAKGASGPPKPVRVVAGPGEAVSVSVGPFVSEVDEAERERERHETKRLLYVAVTRARDRLYFSSVLKEGVLAPGRGSLAEVLPDSLAGLFGRTATAFPVCDVVAWTSSGGRAFEWRICRPPDRAGAGPYREIPSTPVQGSGLTAGWPDKIGWTDPIRQSVTDWLESGGECQPVRAGLARDLTAGTLVHRLFQLSEQFDTLQTDVEELAWAHRLLTREERGSVRDPDALVRAALTLWRDLRDRSDVKELISGGERYHEVPFSLACDDGHAILRGTIDCLIRKPDGPMIVLELKTGTPQPAHRSQLQLYVEAVRQMFPETDVKGQLVYP